MLIINKAITIKKKKHEVVVQNLLNKKQISLNSISFKYLNSFKNKIFSKDDFLNNSSFITLKDEEVEDFFAFLIKNEIIIKKINNESYPFLQFQNETFFDINQKELEETSKHIVIVGIPYDRGNVNSHNIQKASAYLRKLSFQNKIRNHFDEIEQLCGFQVNKLNYIEEVFQKNHIFDIGDLFCYIGESQNNYFNKIENLTKKIISKENFPLFIGGDHSITYPIIKTLQQFTPIGVIHIDAHTDIYNSKIDDFYESISTPHHGNFVRNILKLQNIKHFITLGIRGLNSIGLKDKIYKSNNTNIFSLHQILRDSNWIKSIKKDLPYYLTFDIDVMDYSIAPAVTDPVVEGFTMREISEILNLFIDENINIIGCDFVELEPKNDKANITGQLSLLIILNLLNILAKNKVNHERH